MTKPFTCQQYASSYGIFVCGLSIFWNLGMKDQPFDSSSESIAVSIFSSVSVLSAAESVLIWFFLYHISSSPPSFPWKRWITLVTLSYVFPILAIMFIYFDPILIPRIIGIPSGHWPVFLHHSPLFFYLILLQFSTPFEYSVQWNSSIFTNKLWTGLSIIIWILLRTPSLFGFFTLAATFWLNSLLKNSFDFCLETFLTRVFQLG